MAVFIGATGKERWQRITKEQIKRYMFPMDYAQSFIERLSPFRYRITAPPSVFVRSGDLLRRKYDIVKHTTNRTDISIEIEVK